MNRTEWYAHWREVRRARPKKSLNLGEMARLLREIYEIVLDERDQANYDMIAKYRERVSKRLLDEFERLKELGKKQGKKVWEGLIYSENPLLKAIPKDTSFGGSYILLPRSLPEGEK